MRACAPILEVCMAPRRGIVHKHKTAFRHTPLSWDFAFAGGSKTGIVHGSDGFQNDVTTIDVKDDIPALLILLEPRLRWRGTHRSHVQRRGASRAQARLDKEFPSQARGAHARLPVRPWVWPPSSARGAQTEQATVHSPHTEPIRASRPVRKTCSAGRQVTS